MDSCVPPGFRFHPTEEELVGYYLARKVASQKIDLEVIQEVDLYRIEPWELQERCSDGHYDQEEQTEWYFFSYKDRKYPSGTRTNRATAAGFWKATGRDKPVVSKCKVIGMRKTLVFYRGRAPKGLRTDWIIHEYRLQSTENESTQEEGWVVCRAFKKPCNTHHQRLNYPNNSASYCENIDCGRFGFPALGAGDVNTSFQELGHGYYGLSEIECKENFQGDYLGGGIEIDASVEEEIINSRDGEIVDWKVLDKLLLSQCSNYYESSSSSGASEYDAGGENYTADHFNH